jgi:hypothetical protein
MAIENAQPGYLDDIPLELETIEDNFSKSIARYEYPYVDGADLEDMGERARTVRLRCYFFDNEIQETYDNHKVLIDYLKKRNFFELDHPVYGVINGKVDSVSVRFDDRIRTAEVDLSFIEQGRDYAGSGPVQDVEASAESSFLAGIGEQTDQAAADYAAYGFDTVIELDPQLPIAAQLSVPAYLREMSREVDGYLHFFAAQASAVTQPANSLTATLTFASTLPARTIGILTASVERVARLYDAETQFPDRYLRSLDGAMLKLESALDGFNPSTSAVRDIFIPGNPLQLITAAPLFPSRSAAALSAKELIRKHLVIACAQRLALEAAYCYAADENERRLARRSEGLASFDVLGRYLNPPKGAPYMNARQLEDSLAMVRTRLQGAVGLSRSLESLKAAALDLLTHVSTVKLERERIVQVQIDTPLPLHLVCLKYGLPYSYAERVASLNPQLANPNQVYGALQIYLPGGAA